jgi:hypothetical protein
MKQPVKFSGKSSWEIIAIMLMILCLTAAVGRACKNFKTEQDYKKQPKYEYLPTKYTRF